MRLGLTVLIVMLFLGCNNYKNYCKQKNTFNYSDNTFCVGSYKTYVIPDMEKVFYDRSFMSLEMMDSLPILLINNLKVEIGVHTDTRGSSSYNFRYSEKAASNLREYLIDEKNCPIQQINIKGYGEEFPVVSQEEISKIENKEEQEKLHSKNRRIQITIIDVKD